MRTPIFIVTGLLLAGLLLWRIDPARRTVAAIGFTGVWLVVTVWNLLTGLSHGYTFAEELPIQLVIFAVPVGAAWLLEHKLPDR